MHLGADIVSFDSHEEQVAFEGRTAKLDAWPAQSHVRRRLASCRKGVRGDIARTYTGLRLGANALRGRPALLRVDDILGELVEGMVDIEGNLGPCILRCLNGFVVTRWRNEADKQLFDALFSRQDGEIQAPVNEVVRVSREVRLLVAPVAPASMSLPSLPSMRSGSIPRRERLRIIDWTPLWAGPWMTGQLAKHGHEVIRIEAPQRRDGLLRTKEGREFWNRLNGDKRLELIDASHARGRLDLQQLVRSADVLVSGVTPRVLPQLGLSAEWFTQHGTSLMHLELVAFEPPWSAYPGLGEHAAAAAGLLEAGDNQAQPLPWSDPLLGAWSLLVFEAWLSAGGAAPTHVRLSLEAAARLTFAMFTGLSP